MHSSISIKYFLAELESKKCAKFVFGNFLDLKEIVIQLSRLPKVFKRFKAVKARVHACKIMVRQSNISIFR